MLFVLCKNSYVLYIPGLNTSVPRLHAFAEEPKEALKTYSPAFSSGLPFSIDLSPPPEVEGLAPCVRIVVTSNAQAVAPAPGAPRGAPGAGGDLDKFIGRRWRTICNTAKCTNVR